MYMPDVHQLNNRYVTRLSQCAATEDNCSLSVINDML
jgi:hypothetical protein